LAIRYLPGLRRFENGISSKLDSEDEADEVEDFLRQDSSFAGHDRKRQIQLTCRETLFFVPSRSGRVVDIAFQPTTRQKNTLPKQGEVVGIAARESCQYNDE
jgi:hypothetical protein